MNWLRVHAYEILYLIVLVLAWCAIALLDTGGLPLPALEIAEAADHTLGLLVSQVETYLGLASAIFIASGALAAKGADWGHQWTWFDALMVMVAIACGAVAYQGAFIANAAIIEMVSAASLDISAPRLVRGLRAMHYSSLTGLVLVGWLFVRLASSRRDERSSEAPRAAPQASSETRAVAHASPAKQAELK